MKRILPLIGLFIIAAAAWAQPNNPSVRDTGSDPTGNTCSSAAPILRYSGTYYGCNGSSVYAALAGASNTCTTTPGCTLYNGTTATTQAVGDNSTKVATTAYVANPGAIAPTTVAASGQISGASVVSGTPTSPALAALPAGAYGFAGDESSTAGVPAANVDYCRYDSTHVVKCSLSGAAEMSAITPPLNWFMSGESARGGGPYYGGAVAIALLPIPKQITLHSIYYGVTTLDSNGAHLYDIGIYSCPSNDCSQPGVAMTLICDIGAQPMPAVISNTSHACVQTTPISLPPGIYALSFTGNDSTAQWWQSANLQLPFSTNVLGVSSTGGQLPSSATTPTAGAYQYGQNQLAIGLH